MGLAKLFGGSDDETSLKKLLTKYTRQKSAPPLTVKDFVRASGFYKICTREEILRSVHHVVRDEVIDPDLLLTFNHGSGLHWALQNLVLPDLGVLYGQWKCLGCAKMHGAPETGKRIADVAILRPLACECLWREFVFVEYDLVDDQHRITGHCDGLLALPGLEGFGVLEAKSISSRSAWQVKKTPKTDHVLQGQIYCWLLGLDWLLVVYWEKGAFGLSAIKEHLVKRDDAMIQLIKSRLNELWSGLETGVLTDRICVSPECERAQKCPVRVQCFDGYTPEADSGVGQF